MSYRTSCNAKLTLPKLNIVKVHRIPFADHIVILQNGKVSEQGTYQSLNSSAGYVENLNLRDTIGSQSISEVTAVPINLDAKAHKNDDKQRPNDDLARQTGDLSIYKYYAQSIGWWNLSLFVIYIAAHTVFNAIPTLWLNWWATANVTRPGADLGYVG